MGNYNVDSSFNNSCAFNRVRFGSEFPILEAELNEMQQIQNSQLRSALKTILGNGISSLDAISYNGTLLSIGNSTLVIEGYQLNCTGLAIALANNETAYLQVWEEEITYSDVIRPFGNQQSVGTITNYIKDPRMNIETSRRMCVKYTLSKTIDGSKLINFPIGTITNNKLVLSIGKYTAPGTAIADLISHIGNTTNPHSVTKTQVGLGSVDNTSDANKPVSTPQLTALNLKLDKTGDSKDNTTTFTQAGTLANIATGEKHSVIFGKVAKAIADFITHKNNVTTNPHAVTKENVGLGSVDNTADINKPVSTLQQTALDLKLDKTGDSKDNVVTFSQAGTLANIATGEKHSVILGKIAKAIADFITHKNSTTNPHTVTKTQVGLGSVDNTADANKPVSTLQQAALDLKLDKTGDSKDNTTTFTQAVTLANITTGEKHSVILGKISKAIADLISLILNFNKAVLQSNLTLYVATTGNDTTGDGTSGKPYATISKALSVIPKNLNGYNATINVASGTYAENVLSSGINGGTLTISITGTVTINGYISISSASASISISTATSGSLVVNNTPNYAEGAIRLAACTIFSIGVPTTINSTTMGIFAVSGSSFYSGALLTINNTTQGAIRTGASSKASIVGGIAGSNNAIGLFSDSSIISYTTCTISATTLFQKGNGGIITNENELDITKKTIIWGSGNTPITSLCYKIGNMVHIDFKMAGSTGISSNSELVGMVPADCVPSAPVEYRAGGHALRVGVATYDDSFGILCGVTTGGNIHIANDFGIEMFGACVSINYLVD